MAKYITEEFDIKVSVENVSDMEGIATDINYDPAIVEVVDTDAGTAGTQLDVTNHGFLVGATLVANVIQDAQGNEIPGAVVVGLNIPTSPATGSGDLFSIKFRAIAVGTTTIILTNRALYDIGGEIPANWEDDTLDIIQIATVRVTVV
jgi:hypothetical protein